MTVQNFYATMCMCPLRGKNWDMTTQALENIYKNDAAKKKQHNNQSYSTLFQILLILLYIIQLN